MTLRVSDQLEAKEEGKGVSNCLPLISLPILFGKDTLLWGARDSYLQLISLGLQNCCFRFCFKFSKRWENGAGQKRAKRVPPQLLTSTSERLACICGCLRP